MAAVHPIRPERFLGHTHVSSNKLDPGLHFPLREVRDYSLNRLNVSLDGVAFLRRYKDDKDLTKREEPLEGEGLLSGQYRDHLDGVSEEWDGNPKTYPRLADDKTSFIEALTSLGYHVTPDTYGYVVALFRSRWKKKCETEPGFCNAISVRGGMDKEAQTLLKEMAVQYHKL
jgi:N-acetyl-anhydromuramyl-L-alanine amidase AmpD